MLSFMSGVDRVVDLSRSRGNGPFRDFRGVVLHVNVDPHGTSDSFWQTNSGQVTPNFQVFKSKAAGGVHQILPINWQPWCQVDGNYSYAAIETAGMPNEPLTTYQQGAIARILKVYHVQMGLKLRLANRPGEYGFGTHAMGGAAWGGHSCPGTIRSRQRGHILALALEDLLPVQKPQPTHSGPWLRHDWPGFMPRGEYFGPITGPNESHGGYIAAEKSAIRLIQLRLAHLGFYKASIDGIFGPDDTRAVLAWQKTWTTSKRVHPLGRIYRNDWNHLHTY